MTLAMPDSTRVADLPPGYDAYLGYADGLYPTSADLAKRFPAAHVLTLTVTGVTLLADGIDCEHGNVNAYQAAAWCKWKIDNGAASRPAVYASVSGEPGYGMAGVLAELGHQGIARDRVRLLSAHWTHAPHICGPDSCGAIWSEMDGTQYTSLFPGQGGTVVDMSMLAEDFFAPPTPTPTVNWTEKIMRELGIVRQGDSGEAVKIVQGLCIAHGCEIAVDGIFGAQTHYAVQSCQSGHVTADGVVGPQTWPVLLGVA